MRGYSSIHRLPIAGKNAVSSTLAKASTSKVSLTSLKRYEETQLVARSDFTIVPKPYRGLGDLTRAIEDFDQAIRLDPVARPFRLHDRGNALRDAGQYDRALADYETALKLAPTDAWLLVDRGRTFTKMGRFEAAKSDLDNALRLDPSNLELQRAVET